MAGRALDDLIVVEFAQMVSGPMCGKMFADMGAEVIKIEPVGAGDEMRAHPRFPTDIPHPEKRRVPLPQHEQVCIAKTSMSTGGSKLPPLLQLVEQRSG